MNGKLMAASFAALITFGGALAPSASAQVVIGGRGGIWVGPGPGISVRVGRFGIPGPVPYVLPRRRLALYGAPPTVPPAGAYAQRGSTAQPYGGNGASYADGGESSQAAAPPSDAPLPTAAELAALADTELLNALLALSARLDADLNRFTSAASWQRYLRLPDDALPPPENGRVTLGMRSLTAHRAKFESVAANPNFAQIFSVPSFAATRMALDETVRRFADQANAPGPAATTGGAPARAVSEELPLPPVAPSAAAAAASRSPALVAPQNKADGERSILLVK